MKLLIIKNSMHGDQAIPLDKITLIEEGNTVKGVKTTAINGHLYKLDFNEVLDSLSREKDRIIFDDNT